MGENARKVRVNGVEVGLYALDEIFERLRNAGLSGDYLADELLRQVKSYNFVPEDLAEAYRGSILSEYETYIEEKARESGG